MIQVDGDHEVGAHCAQHVDRHGIDQAAIDEHMAVVTHRRENAGHRNARPHRLDDAARGERHLLAGGNVRGHGAKGNRQLLDVFHVEMPAHEISDLLAVDKAGSGKHRIEQQGDAAPVEHQELGLEALQLAGSEDRADEGAHAGARNALHLDAALDQRAQR